MSQRSSPLESVHDRQGAQFTDFGGWKMPVEFESIREEHAAVRETAGKFDVSHMSQLAVSGPDAGTLCQRLVTNDVLALDPGEAQYAAITDDDGIMLDDTVLYRLPADEDDDYLVVPNAGHGDEMYDRWVAHRDEWGLDATVENQTDEYAMIAVQGPDAPELLAGETPADLDAIAPFEAASTTVAGADALVANTGYTGEAGFEVLLTVDLSKDAAPSEIRAALRSGFAEVTQAVAVLEGSAGGLPVAGVAPILGQTGHGLVSRAPQSDPARNVLTLSDVAAVSLQRDLDGQGQGVDAISEALDQAAAEADAQRGVIVLGRMRPDTVRALSLWSGQGGARRVALAPVSAVLSAQDDPQTR